jgi:hypothetical protein
VTTLDIRTRQDLHNSSVSFAAAVVGLCGFTHLATGRTCVLRYRHPGPCQLEIVADDESSPGGVAGRNKVRLRDSNFAASARS